MLVENPPYAPLALCATYAMGDKRFRDLIAALVELEPAHWPLALEFVESISAGCGPAGGADPKHLKFKSSA
jgi:hypothetical protein